MKSFPNYKGKRWGNESDEKEDKRKDRLGDMMSNSRNIRKK